MRTHLIMISHRLATFQDIKNGNDKRQASPECSVGEIGRRNGRGFTEGSKGACKGSGKLVLREEKSSSFRLPQEARGHRQWKAERFQERRE